MWSSLSDADTSTRLEWHWSSVGEISRLGEDVSLDALLPEALEEEPDGGDEGDVRYVSGSVAAGEHAADAALAINDDRARVSGRGEGARL